MAGGRALPTHSKFPWILLLVCGLVLPIRATVTINGNPCSLQQVITVDNECNPAAPDYDAEGMVCANDGTPQEAYCSYNVGVNACARCAPGIQEALRSGASCVFLLMGGGGSGSPTILPQSLTLASPQAVHRGESLPRLNHGYDKWTSTVTCGT